jgi:tetratricopeptide (TPR) repeat protein
MSLAIFVSSKTVIISRYQLEFAFVPPAQNLTAAALGAYHLLRQSVAIQLESSRNEREEAMALLREYGQALYRAILPESCRQQVAQAGGLFVYSSDPDIIELPWELLYDGFAFLALTQGVVRINDSGSPSLSPEPRPHRSRLKISLNAYSPLPPPPLGNRFISHIEELVLGNVSNFPLIDFAVDGHSSRQSILKAIAACPDVLLFSGHETEQGWLLHHDASAGDDPAWFSRQLKPALREAIGGGLRILVLMTSGLFGRSAQKRGDLLSTYFELGVRCVISIHGRISRHRFREYFQNFLIGLVREEPILRAHRYAINSIQGSLPLSWDWTWIQLHLNRKLLEAPAGAPLPPFRFVRQETGASSVPITTGYAAFNYHRFSGNSEVFARIEGRLLSAANDNVLFVQTTEGMLLEEYLQEFIRRHAPRHRFRLSILYYHRWGHHQGQSERFPSTPYAQMFPFLLGDTGLSAYFDQCLITVPLPQGTGMTAQYLAVYYPPQRIDPAFDVWLQRKQAEGWKVVFLGDDSVRTGLSTDIVSTDDIKASELSNAFEDELPEIWHRWVADPLPPSLRNVTLLKIARRARLPAIVAGLQREHDGIVLWRSLLQGVLTSLPAQQYQILLALYLLRVKCGKGYLAKLLAAGNIEPDLDALVHLHLIGANLEATEYWIPLHLRAGIHRYELIPEAQLLGFGRELLQRQIAGLKGFQLPSQSQMSGFQYCVNEMARLGSIENPLLRNLQYGRKLSRYQAKAPMIFYPHICTSIELALKDGRKALISRTLFAILNILENLPLEDQTVKVYDWLLKTEEQNRNWATVSEILVKKAALFARKNMKQKAIGLIGSAVQLNNDIRNYTNRHQNLITIALLLLDLEEYEKVRDIITQVDFEFKKLSDQLIARLWLIDGHLLFQEKKYSEAADALDRVLHIPTPPIPDRLLAKTYLHRAIIHEVDGESSQHNVCVKKAALLYERAGDMAEARNLHEKTVADLLAAGEHRGVIDHLEWLFQYYREAGENERARSIADQLGGLYFKAGNHSQSTHYYSIAQGM